MTRAPSVSVSRKVCTRHRSPFAELSFLFHAYRRRSAIPAEATTPPNFVPLCKGAGRRGEGAAGRGKGEATHDEEKGAKAAAGCALSCLLFMHVRGGVVCKLVLALIIKSALSGSETGDRRRRRRLIGRTCLSGQRCLFPLSALVSTPPPLTRTEKEEGRKEDEEEAPEKFV